MKRVLSLLVAAAMLASLAACGGGNASSSGSTTDTATSSNTSSSSSSTSSSTSTSTATTDQAAAQTTVFPPATYTVYCGDSLNTSTKQWNETEIGKMVEEITGITLKTEYIVGANEEEKAGLIIASGDYPDIIIPHNVGAVFRDAGALIPLNDLYEENCPTIQSQWGNAVNRIKDPETGILWGMSAMEYNSPAMDYPFSAYFIKYDAVESNGNKILTNTDDYFNLIREYVAAHPTTNGQSTIGFSGPAEGWRFVFSLMGGDKLAGWHNTGDRVYDPNNNWKASYRATLECRHDYMMLLNQLNREGLLDPEMLSQTHDQYVAKVASGRVVGYYDEWWEVMDAFRLIKDEGRKQDMYVSMPVVNTGVKNDPYAGIAAMSTQLTYCISVNAKDPAGILKFLDYMASDDMLTLRYWGVEGVDYQKNADGRRYLTAEQYATRDKGLEYNDRTGIGHTIATAMPHPLELYAERADGSGVYDPKVDPDRAQYIYDDNEKSILSALGWETFMDGLGPMWKSPYGYGWDIALPADDDELNEINNQLATINTDVYMQKMIMAASASEAEAVWDELQAALQTIELGKLEQFYQGMVQQRVTEWN